MTVIRNFGPGGKGQISIKPTSAPTVSKDANYAIANYQTTILQKTTTANDPATTQQERSRLLREISLDTLDAQRFQNLQNENAILRRALHKIATSRQPHGKDPKLEIERLKRIARTGQ